VGPALPRLLGERPSKGSLELDRSDRLGPRSTRGADRLRQREDFAERCTSGAAQTRTTRVCDFSLHAGAGTPLQAQLFSSILARVVVVRGVGAVLLSVRTRLRVAVLGSASGWVWEGERWS
jgi:hypothetical protein